MFKVLRDWIQRYFSDEEAVVKDLIETRTHLASSFFTKNTGQFPSSLSRKHM